MSNTEQQRSAICRAITSFGHSISADKVILHRDNGEKDNLLTLIVDAVEKELAALSAQSAVQEPVMRQFRCRKLSESAIWSIWRDMHDYFAADGLEYEFRNLYTHPSSAAQVEEIRNAERWAAMRELLVAVDFQPEMGGGPVVMFECHSDVVGVGPQWADKIADAAIDYLKTPAPSKGEGS